MGEMADDYSGEWDDSDDVACRFIAIARETKAAYLITFEIDEEFKAVQAWLPKSQVSISGNTIYIPRWLITDKELEPYEL